MDMNSDARATMNRWRNSVKSKQRRIFRFDERVNIRLDAINQRMVTVCHPVPDWQIKQVRFIEVGHYETLEDWREIHVGDTWGGEDVSAFFKRQITIPDAFTDLPVTLRFYVGGDSLLSLNGVPYHGLDPFRSVVHLPNDVVAGQTIDIDIESYVHWHSGEASLNIFHEAELVSVDSEIEAAYWDFVAAFKVLTMDNIDTRLQAFLEKHLWDALLQIPIHDDFDTFKVGCLDAQTMIRETIYSTDRFKGEGLMHLVGHSHLDLVFMWPYREYIRKVGRTHATMLRLMEQYPDFKFSQSSAKIYLDMKENFPEVYEQVKERIAEGRWEAIGALWVEPDCNLINGESFVRQILYGQRFWQEEFGVQSETCWLPDVFGNSWAMPQILQRSGIKYFLTNKMFVWNDTNRWRSNTFWWQGSDGSRVLGVVPPGHFIGMVDPDHMDKHWRDFSDKETIGESLYCYGWGDGGGGVDPEMLECAVRYQDFPGLVPLKFSHPEEALASIASNATDDNIPTWRNELYLEAHRGTFTNKGRLKKLNRQAEQLYRQAEMLATFAWLKGADYPSNALDSGWQDLLTTQFHDSLPGTHISEVYPFLLNEYDNIFVIGEQVRDDALQSMFEVDSDGENLLIMNTLPRPIVDQIEIPADILSGKLPTNVNGNVLPAQSIIRLEGTESVLITLSDDDAIPAVGTRIFNLADATANTDVGVTVEVNALENQYLRAEFNETGELTRLWDKVAERDVLLDGEVGNQFKMYEDKPGKYDAWDIVATYTEHEMPLRGTVTLESEEAGALRGSLKLTRTFGDSKLIQRISLSANQRSLTFETEIDWYERQRLLKVGFPLAINAEKATYDIAYGNIQRATHRNTSYDAAMFEVPAHWWMDMSEGNYGVALLNDCKYGYEADGNLMRLTLLKGSIYPDPTGDREMHHFTYVLQLHDGDWRMGDVHGQASLLNTPLIFARTNQAVASQSLLSYEADNVTLEAIKRSEDGEYLIVRLVERYNQLTRLPVTFNQAIQSAWTCDLMEREEVELEPDGNTVAVRLKPNEIVTVKVKL